MRIFSGNVQLSSGVPLKNLNRSVRENVFDVRVEKSITSFLKLAVGAVVSTILGIVPLKICSFPASSIAVISIGWYALGSFGDKTYKRR